MHDTFPHCSKGYSAFVTDDEGVTRWWTFAEYGANAVLTQTLSAARIGIRHFDNFTMTLSTPFNEELPGLLRSEIAPVREAAWEPWMDRTELKFSLCLPEPLAKEALVARVTDPEGAQRILENPVRVTRMH